MHTTTSTYKGFNVDTVSYDGLGTVTFRFFVKGDGFKTEGYPTMNHAKGAITKHLNAQATPATMEAQTTGAIKAVEALAATKAVKPSRRKAEGFYVGKYRGEHKRMRANSQKSFGFSGKPFPCWIAALVKEKDKRRARAVGANKNNAVAA